MDKYRSLPDQIWTTRISRINAEKRLINKESFFQGINIYYSCLTIIFSILSLAHSNKVFTASLVTCVSSFSSEISPFIVTISLLIVILYLNGQRYLERAREYRKNYTKMQKLEFDLMGVGNDDMDSIQRIYIEYCDLLDSGNNHISFDYYETVHRSTGEYREKRWKNVRKIYWWNVIWRFMLKVVIIILPVVLYVVCEVL